MHARALAGFDARCAETTDVGGVGIALGVISLIPFFGVLGLIGLPVSIVGLRKVDEDAWPPVGLRKRAIWGIVLSCIGMLISAALFTSILLKE